MPLLHFLFHTVRIQLYGGYMVQNSVVGVLIDWPEKAIHFDGIYCFVSI